MSEIQTVNPANKLGKDKAELKRIPMSAPVQKLEVGDIPGFHLHWMRNDPSRIAQAQRAGYTFVTPDEINVSNVSLGGTTAVSGNTDLGSMVSVVAGGEVNSNNQPVRLILMKLPQELWEQDQKAVENRNDRVAQALNGGSMGGEGAQDRTELNMRYLGQRTKLPDMFTKKVSRK